MAVIMILFLPGEDKILSEMKAAISFRFQGWPDPETDGFIRAAYDIQKKESGIFLYTRAFQD